MLEIFDIRAVKGIIPTGFFIPISIFAYILLKPTQKWTWRHKKGMKKLRKSHPFYNSVWHVNIWIFSNPVNLKNGYIYFWSKVTNCEIDLYIHAGQSFWVIFKKFVLRHRFALFFFFFLNDIFFLSFQIFQEILDHLSQKVSYAFQRAFRKYLAINSES